MPKPGLELSAEDQSRFQCYLASNLTLCQFRYWQQESIDENLPLRQNLYTFEIPAKPAPHLPAAWA
jgi:hypothetical protein